MPGFETLILAVVLLVIPLYPKFPLLGISGSFVAVRLEDFIIAFALLVFFAGCIRRRFSDFFTPMSRTILLYLVVGFVASFSGIFLTKTASVNLGFLHAFRRVEYLSLFFIGAASLRKITDLHFIIRVVLLTGLIVAVFGLGQQFAGFPVISTTNSEFSKGLALQLGPGARINSTFAGHYDLAAFCVFPLLLIIALLPISRHKLLLLLLGGIVYWTLLLSASRITFASFFLAAGALLLVIRKPLWLLPLAALATVGFFGSPQLRGRYLELLKNHLKISVVQTVSAQDPTPISRDVRDTPDALKPAPVAEDRSFNIRLQAEWPRAIRAVLKNPVLGTGFSSVGLAVDNEFLRVLAETGVLGFLAFTLIFLRFFKSSMGVIIKYTPSVPTAFIVAVSASLLSLMITAVFIDIFTASKIAIFAWAMVGSAQAVKNKLI